MVSTGLKVLFAASEMAPLVKTGGLGDVAGDLPRALAALGVEVTLALPHYQAIQAGRHGFEPAGFSLRVPVGQTIWPADVWQGRLHSCPVYLLGNRDLFARGGIYGYGSGDFGDNALRFAFFNRAVLELAKSLGPRLDVLHVNDWQTSLLPAYISSGRAQGTPLQDAATVLTIHNLAYQGLFERDEFRLTGLPAYMNQMQGMEFWGRISYLKAGLVTAQAITTVSPTYAREIITPQGGQGLEGVLAGRSGDLHGILNGVDYEKWSPQEDASLPARYGPAWLEGKRECREALVNAFGLEKPDQKTMVVGFVGRFTDQKGVDLIAGAIPDFMDKNIRFCLLGTGDPQLEERLKVLSWQYPGKVGVRVDFDEDLAHLIYGGSDLFVMPSRFEPCGLSQIYALRYGSPPLVRATGGLLDTVEPFDPKTGQGSGFLFQEPEPEALSQALSKALSLWEQPQLWRRLMLNAMRQDFSWDKSARAYRDLYRQLTAPKE